MSFLTRVPVSFSRAATRGRGRFMIAVALAALVAAACSSGGTESADPTPPAGDGTENTQFSPIEEILDGRIRVEDIFIDVVRKDTRDGFGG